jgi:transcription initiation factor IIE alpha subunit
MEINMKKTTGIKYEFDSYSMKKHHCPDCGSILKTVEVSKVIDPKSQEREGHDFQLGHDTYMVGPTRFVCKEFECPNCGKHLTVKEMKEHERLINSKQMTECERQKMQEQKNVKVIILTVIIVVVLFMFACLIKACS